MRKTFYLLLLLGVCMLNSCKDDLANAGSSLLDFSDSIIVKSDTFALSSSLRLSPDVISMPDSFLVGELETRFGTLRASLLTQLCCPEGFRFPVGSELDSICLFLYYGSWVGDAYSPMALNIYELDGDSVLSDKSSVPYMTSVKMSDYCSRDDSVCVITEQRIVVAGKATDSVASDTRYMYRVRFRLSDDFLKRFTDPYLQGDDNGLNKMYEQASFSELFKGLCVCSDFGSSTILNVQNISMGVYYHYGFERNETTGVVKDTVSDMKAFYANSEVRQVNVFEYLNDHGDRDVWMNHLSHATDTCYIIAPAGIYTTLKLPMAAMAESIESNLMDKRPYVNLAQLRVDVLENGKGSSSWLSPSPSMLLMCDKPGDDSSIENFFQTHSLPSDTLAILGSLVSQQDTLGNDHMYYTFDISSLLTKQLREADARMDTLYMTMVPVTVESSTLTDGSTSIIGIKQAQTLSATIIRSAENVETPLTLKVVYSGF